MIKKLGVPVRSYLTKLSVMQDKTGAVTLIMTLVLLLLSTMIIIFAANYGILQSKAIANNNRNQQAFETAQAGLEYGINYLNKRSTTILANPVGGYIQPYSDSNTSNVTLANNSRYTVTYSNPTANDYSVIKITSVGTSDDGTSTRTVSQLVKYGSMLLNAPTIPMKTKGSVSLSGNSNISNTQSNTTIQSASTVALNNSAVTTLNSGTSSSAGDIKSDIVQNDTTLNSTSSSDFFTSYFGISPALLKSSAENTYSSSVDRSYRSQLFGQTGTSIWIDQSGGTATLNGFLLIGSSSDPVIMVVEGNNNFTGFVFIYGFVYVNGTTNIASGADVSIVGGLATTGTVTGPGSLQVYYSPSVLRTLQGQSGMQYYAKIPGSWRDF